MTPTDYILDIALIALVLRQVREARFGWHAILLPVAVCTWVCAHYLRSVPTDGNNLVLVALFTAVGIACGLVSALTTRVRAVDDGPALVRAGAVAAAVWVASMTGRFAFVLWTTHGGAADLGRFSMQHHITSGDAWTAALVLMAMGEVFVRTGLLWTRAHRARQVRRVSVATDTAVLVAA